VASIEIHATWFHTEPIPSHHRQAENKRQNRVTLAVWQASAQTHRMLARLQIFAGTGGGGWFSRN